MKEVLFFCIFLLLVIVFIRLLFGMGIKKTKPKLKPFGYRLIYTDQKTRTKKEGTEYSKILYSEKYNIQGKPDFLYRSKFSGRIIPVELKSGKIGNEELPHEGDFLQLIAYFLIVESVYGVRPKKGRLIYRDYMFEVRNLRKYRKMLLSTLDDMRAMLKSGEGEPVCDYVRCRHCICKAVCEYFEGK